MTPDDPRHGTPAGFYAHRTEGVKACGPCELALYRYHKQWRGLRSKGLRCTVPSGPITEHIRILEDAGMIASTILAASGVTRSAFYHLREGRYLRCRAVIAERILAVEPGAIPLHVLAAKQLIPNVGCRRRIRALLALGWTHQELTNRSGVLTAVKINQVGDMVTAEVHRKVAEMYDELSMIIGPSDRTRLRAAKLGYSPPLAWDNETIDDPKAKPQGISFRNEPAVLDDAAIERRIAGDRSVRLHKGETAEVVRRLLAAGTSSRTIHRDYGIKAERYIKVSELERAA